MLYRNINSLLMMQKIYINKNQQDLKDLKN